MPFIRTNNENHIVNTDHIRSLAIQSPMYEQKDYIVYANILQSGSIIMYRGTEEGCRKYLGSFLRRFGEERKE